MGLDSSVFTLNAPETVSRITRFISDYVSKVRASGVVLGLSGGIDSSTTLALCVRALGPERVLPFFMPEKETYAESDRRHVIKLIRQLGCKFEAVDITVPVDSFRKIIPGYDARNRIADGNLKARSRMVVLYYYANLLNKLVVGTSDKSESMMGYFTKWGDCCADIAPLLDLYKTQVRELARHLGLPRDIVAKPSSPMLWPGQTAEAELGMTYETLDLILYGLEHFMNVDQISKETGILAKTVAEVERRWIVMEHKRRLPLVLKLGYRTIGHDFRLPIYSELHSAP